MFPPNASAASGSKSVVRSRRSEELRMLGALNAYQLFEILSNSSSCLCAFV